MEDKIRALKAAFPCTIPVLTGFTFLGIAYGILMSSKGYGVGWTVLMSLMAFAGSAQYVAITFLTSVFNPIYALLMTLVVNARHLFYGISMLDRYKGAGKLKPYLIFGLCDETFSIVCSAEPPEGVNRNWFSFFITLLNHSYWVLGSAIGGMLGSMVSFNTKGLDFVLTALFVVIFVGQWKTQKDHKPAVIGVLCSIICLVVFGQSNFIIPSMIAILAVLMISRKEYMEKKELIEEIVQ
ncbi:4-azaleucine resistance transporter AzlC [Anaerosolibacter carboniphilus]|uniref:4-azaleucine resistance transporter AzlC n=1 Tax=Anaerosolibacter carboniphilus TaxID=1417629 RepID=A0A841KRU0_9FIRM|nr:AzlC family ABC transporter permease [Anaerosolibacter carboniphilus]MBB6214780.1 4-azaleucine resistance transporter AzlC [Anaerosolibacter carboniphilus]